MKRDETIVLPTMQQAEGAFPKLRGGGKEGR